MKIYEFYRKFEDLPKEKRFLGVKTTPTMVSAFVIFKQLEQARAQKRYFEMREEELLAQAEEVFKQING